MQARWTLATACIAFTILMAWPCTVYSAESSCVECHDLLDDSETSPTQLMSHDIHAKRGISCHDCHGGDPNAEDAEVAMDPANGFIGTPDRSAIPEFCAKCHADPAYMRRYNPNLPTDQYLKYQSSQHGKRIATGDTDVAVCTSCHMAHGIRTKNDPLSPVYPTNIPHTCVQCHADEQLMERHNLPTDQFEKYVRSVHGRALLERGDRGAPHCASCHGSHEAARPGTIAVGNICAQCHGLQRDMFAKSKHKAVHEEMGLPECEVCHGNHLILEPTDEMLGTGPDALCASCHEEGSVGFRTAQEMRESIERLKMGLGSATVVINQARELGMDMTDADFTLHEASTRLTQARSYVHSFSAETIEPIVEEGLGLSGQAREKGDAAIEEFHFRRHGLWLTLAILFVFVILLAAMIRQVDSSSSQEADKKDGA